MRTIRALIRLIDGISDRVGKGGCLFVGLLLVVLCFEVMARYIFNKPTIWATDISKMISLTITSLGFAYTFLHKGHIRIDVIYARFSARGQAIIDVICAVFFLFPVLFTFLFCSGAWMAYAWANGEKWFFSTFFPPLGPVRSVFFIGWCLLTMQALAQFIRDLYFFVKRKSL